MTRIAVIGAGLMGHGIAQVFALAGHRVMVYDPSTEALMSLRDRVRRNLGELGQDTRAAERVRRLPVLGPLENADVVGIDLTLAIHATVLPAIDRRPGP